MKRGWPIAIPNNMDKFHKHYTGQEQQMQKSPWAHLHLQEVWWQLRHLEKDGCLLSEKGHLKSCHILTLTVGTVWNSWQLYMV